MTDEDEKGKSLRELRHEDAEDEVDIPDIEEENPLSNTNKNQSAV